LSSERRNSVPDFGQRIERLNDGQREALAAVLAGTQSSGNGGNHVEHADQLVAYVATKSDIDSAELRQFLIERLPRHMIPSQFVFVDALPRSANGKLARTRLSIGGVEHPGSALTRAARSDIEQKLAAVWCDVLAIPDVSIDDNYFELGGDSLKLIRLVARSQKTGLEVTPSQVYEHPTIASLAAHLEGKAQTVAASDLTGTVNATAQSRIISDNKTSPETGSDPIAGKAVQLSEAAGKPPLFLLPPKAHHFGNFRHLAACISDFTCFSPFTPEEHCVDRLKIEDLVPDFLKQIREVQSAGPYRLAGFCEGAYIAWEIARQLTSSGETVSFLGIIDTPNPRQLTPIRESLRDGIRRRLKLVSSRNPIRFAARLATHSIDWTRRRVRQSITQELHLTRVGTRMAWLYRPESYAGHATLFRVAELPEDALFQADVAYGWGGLSLAGLDIITIPGIRNEAELPGNFLSPPHAAVLARQMQLAIHAREQPIAGS
jgi:thioesterase domain-containing protein/aryl carrier-like protein